MRTAGVKNQSPSNHGVEGAKSGLGVAHQQILYTILPLLLVPYYLYNQGWISRRHRRWQIRDERRAAAVTVEEEKKAVESGDVGCRSS